MDELTEYELDQVVGQLKRILEGAESSFVLVYCTGVSEEADGQYRYAGAKVSALSSNTISPAIADIAALTLEPLFIALVGEALLNSEVDERARLGVHIFRRLASLEAMGMLGDDPDEDMRQLLAASAKVAFVHESSNLDWSKGYAQYRNDVTFTIDPDRQEVEEGIKDAWRLTVYNRGVPIGFHFFDNEEEAQTNAVWVLWSTVKDLLRSITTEPI